MNEATKHTMESLEKELERSLAQIKSEPINTTLARPGLLSERLDKLEAAHRHIREQIATERSYMLAEHDRRWTEIQNEFREKILAETQKLERARDTALKALTDEYNAKKRELDLVTARIDS